MFNPRLFNSVTVLVSLVFGHSAMGQPVPTKLPDSVHLFPAGAQQGTTVRVHIGVEQAPPRTNFFIRGDGVVGDSVLVTEVLDAGQPSPRRAPTEVPIHYPRQWAGEVTVAADAPVGTAYWDIFCASGGSSGSLPFVVGSLPEFIETESNSTPQSAESIELPVTLNGQIHGERDLDYFRFALQAGQVVYCEVLARRLGSRLEPTVSLLDSDGHAVSYQEDSLGDDPLVAFKAPSDGAYLLQVGNVSVHGSPAHVYRINMTTAPVASYAYPVGAPAGASAKFFFYAMSGDGDVLVVERELTLPADAGDVFQYSDPLLANTVPLRVLPAGAKTIETRARLDVAELPIAVGEVSNGRLSPLLPDVYVLDVQRQEPLNIRVIASASVSAASLILMEIADPTGKPVGRAKVAFTADAVKASHYLANPKVGNYTITLKSVGGLAAVHRVAGYQLEVLPARFDFRLTAGRDCLSVTQGSSLEIPVKANRAGGFKGEIRLNVEGLPEGVTVEDDVIAEGKNDVKLKFTIPDTLASTRYEIRLAGVAAIVDEEVSRPVQVQHRGHDSFGRSVHGVWRDVIALAVRHKPVFRLHCEEAYQYAHRGTIYPYTMTLERLGEFKEPVVIQRGDRQNRDLDGIEFVQTTVGIEQASFSMPIFLPETMHINIQSQSQLYTQAYASFTDSHGQKQHALFVSEKRNMLRTLPTVVKLSADGTALAGKPGDVVSVRFELERTSNMQNAMRLELVQNIAEGFDVPVQQFTRGQVLIDVPITIPDEMTSGDYQLTFKASGALDAKPDQTAITSATVTLHVE
ncbi:MAG: hypothetical protein ABGZ23_18515 [Fuerstiella sp.]|nr:hypothetical protein [Fuerstiella sp.]